MADNPIAVPSGRNRVDRFRQDAEDAATGSAPAAAPTSSTDAGTGINFFNGKVSTPEQKAKSGKALQDLLKNRAEADSDDDTATA